MYAEDGASAVASVLERLRGSARRDAPAGGVIGRELAVTWSDLDDPAMPHRWRTGDLESAVDRHDFELAFRLDVLVAAVDGEKLAEPVATPLTEAGRSERRLPS